MAETVDEGTTFEITCPHCKKRFSAELMTGDAARYRGFKCPHCKLFIPAERVKDQLPRS
jgi:DNA-directed RNA polymerase subunit RPC12/RpoP